MSRCTGHGLQTLHVGGAGRQCADATDICSTCASDANAIPTYTPLLTLSSRLNACEHGCRGGGGGNHCRPPLQTVPSRGPQRNLATPSASRPEGAVSIATSSDLTTHESEREKWAEPRRVRATRRNRHYALCALIAVARTIDTTRLGTSPPSMWLVASRRHCHCIGMPR